MPKTRRRAALYAILAVIAVVILTLTTVTLINHMPKLRYDYYKGNAAAVPYPDTRFAVISDIHVYDTDLGATGAAFEEVMASDRKLLLDTEALLDIAVADILAADVPFVLVSGDLTKDGERVNHELVAAKLKPLRDAGMPVYVVPGNHDVNNPRAERYVGDNAERVPNVSADEFAEIYRDYGYDGALYRDTDSLSYVAEPAPGLWLLAIDACRYRENKDIEIVSGKISQHTEDWIVTMLNLAIRQDKAVMAMIHHGVAEHWDGQRKLHPDYLIADYARFARLLASYNVRVAFSGHYHGQDISQATYGGKTIYDVMTGSLVTPACPARFCAFDGGRLDVTSRTYIGQLRPDPADAAAARQFVKDTVASEAMRTLAGFKVPDDDAAYIAEAVAAGFAAHYAGDENPALQPPFDQSRLGLWARVVYATQAYVLRGLWHDTPPVDNFVTLDLR